MPTAYHQPKKERVEADGDEDAARLGDHERELRQRRSRARDQRPERALDRLAPVSSLRLQRLVVVGSSLMIPARSIPRRPRTPLSSRAAPLLERVDRVLARCESVCAVRGGDGDHDRRLADLDASDRWWIAIVCRSYRAFGTGREAGHQRLRHLRVRLVVEVVHGRGRATRWRTVPVNVATAPARSAAHLRDGRVERERLVRHDERAARDGRDQRDLVAVRELAVALGVLPVDRVEQAVRLLAEPECGPESARSATPLGAARSLGAARPAPRALTIWLTGRGRTRDVGSRRLPVRRTGARIGSRRLCLYDRWRRPTRARPTPGSR